MFCPLTITTEKYAYMFVLNRIKDDTVEIKAERN